MLNFEQGRMSLLEAINDPVNLMIYPNITSNAASGQLYLDDGETNNYLTGEYTYVQFNWDGAALIVTKTVPDNVGFSRASGKFINKAQIFNISAPPLKVRNAWVSDMSGQIESYIDFIFSEEESSLTLHNFFIPVDSGLVYQTPTALFELLY